MAATNKKALLTSKIEPRNGIELQTPTKQFHACPGTMCRIPGLSREGCTHTFSLMGRGSKEGNFRAIEMRRDEQKGKNGGPPPTTREGRKSGKGRGTKVLD